DMVLDQYNADYESLLKSYQDANLAEAQSLNSVVAAEAQAEEKPLQPRPLLDMFMAALVGLVLAVVVGLAADAGDDRVRSFQDVAEAGGLATVGVLAQVADTEVLGPENILSDPNTQIAESFKTLRTNLEFARLDHELNTILVCSPERGEGKTTVAIGL